MSLEQLLQRADIWRGREHAPPPPGSTLATGHGVLDARLGGGWPRGALIELLGEQQGFGEVSLLLPALAAASRERWVALIAPPHLPYAPALADAGVTLSRLLWVRPANAGDGLWACEQLLRSGLCAALLYWPPPLQMTPLRRLQLAAEQGNSCAFLYRPLASLAHPSPAALRLTLAPRDGALTLAIHKQRGSWGATRLTLTPRHALA